MTNVLLVEDDSELGDEIVQRLRREGYTVEWIRDGDEARAKSLDGFELVLLDLGLPGTYGMDVLKAYRQSSDIPVLILTARDHTADKIRGLSLGADDYMTKPFWPDELIARVAARLRRPAMRREVEPTLKVGKIRVDVEGARVEIEGVALEVTRAELQILATLAQRAGRAVSRAELADIALEQGSERALDVHVSRLRKKMGAEGERLKTVWGVGYRLENENP